MNANKIIDAADMTTPRSPADFVTWARKAEELGGTPDSCLMNVPRRLYKYRSLTGKNREYAQRAIAETEIYFPRCTEFNDPFDCRLNVRGEFDPTQKQQMERATESIGIFCLSARNDSLLMWSHYADGHRGICLEFSTSQDQLFGCRLDPVVYEEHPELFVGDTINLDWARKYLTTKARDWSYEQEWRIMYSTPGAQTAPPKELSAVILGCSISISDRQEVVEWVSARRVPTRVYQAGREEGAFRLRFSPNVP